jgi:hypothetical protein
MLGGQNGFKPHGGAVITFSVIITAWKQPRASDSGFLGVCKIINGFCTGYSTNARQAGQ